VIPFELWRDLWHKKTAYCVFNLHCLTFSALCIPVTFSLVKIVVSSNAVEVGLLVVVREAVSLTATLVAEVLSVETVLLSTK